MSSAVATAKNRRLAAPALALPESVTPEGAAGRVLNAALRLFALDGYSSTSVRDLCREAGVQATTLYAHFPSKAHVLAEIITRGHEEHYRRLQGALLDSGAEPENQLYRLVREHVLAHCEHPMLAVVASDELHALSDELAAPALAVRRQSEGLLVNVLKRGMEMGRFSVDDPFLALRAIGGMGLRVAYWFGPDCGRDADTVAESFAGFAARIVGAGQPG